MNTFGKYEVRDLLGEGGFGVVYRGFDPLLKREVAIKTIDTLDPEVRARFFREAEISARLHHRNVVVVFDFGLEGDIPFLVQELLDGEDLDVKMERDRLPFSSKLLYLIQIAKGLQHAHRNGVVHRDIKPANVRVLPDETVKIMDFGVARLMDGTRTLTRAGRTLGTASYLAPEQIQGRKVDARADIFSFGLLAYELMSGEQAFPEGDVAVVLASILHSEPRPLAEIARACPSGMIRLIETCLRKDPDERYANCGELLAELNALLDGSATTQPSPPQSSRLEPIGSGNHADRPQATSPSKSARTQPLPLPGFSTHDLEGGQGQIREAGPPRFGGSAHAQNRRRGPAFLALTAFVAMLAVGLWLWPGSGSANESAKDDDFGLGGDREPQPARAASARSAASVAPLPSPGTLIFEPPWDPRTTVSIDRDSDLLLDREQRISVEPGKPHRLDFSLITPHYQSNAVITVRLAPGERQTVEVPIPRPGALSVRAEEGARPAFVRIGEELLGPSPIREYQLAPGIYEILLSTQPRAGDGPSWRQLVEIGSSQLTRLTFDLDRGLPPEVVAVPWEQAEL